MVTWLWYSLDLCYLSGNLRIDINIHQQHHQSRVIGLSATPLLDSLAVALHCVEHMQTLGHLHSNQKIAVLVCSSRTSSNNP